MCEVWKIKTEKIKHFCKICSEALQAKYFAKTCFQNQAKTTNFAGIFN